MKRRAQAIVSIGAGLAMAWPGIAVAAGQGNDSGRGLLGAFMSVSAAQSSMGDASSSAMSSGQYASVSPVGARSYEVTLAPTSDEYASAGQTPSASFASESSDDTVIDAESMRAPDQSASRERPATVVTPEAVPDAQDPNTATYGFTTEGKGDYRVSLSGIPWTSVVFGSQVKVIISDQAGNVVFTNNGDISKEAIRYADEKGEMMEQVAYSVGLDASTDYTVRVTYDHVAMIRTTICYPNESVDLTDVDAYGDTFEGMSQINTYTITPSVTGRYRLALSGADTGVQALLNVYDARNNSVDLLSLDMSNKENKLNYKNFDGTFSNILSSDTDFYVELNAGKTYQIRLEQGGSALGEYTLEVGKPNASLDISGASLVKDAFSFRGETSAYSYTAPSDGTYALTVDGMEASSQIRLSMVTDDGSSVLVNTHTYDLSDPSVLLTSGQTVAANLIAGHTYTILASQCKGNDAFELGIVSPHEPVEATGCKGVSGALTYSGQTDDFTWTMAHDGDALTITSRTVSANSAATVSVISPDGTVIASGLLRDMANKSLTTEAGAALSRAGTTYTIRVSDDGALRSTFDTSPVAYQLDIEETGIRTSDEMGK